LVVFVVGEQPTRGISDEEFKNALLWFSKLDPDNREPFIS